VSAECTCRRSRRAVPHPTLPYTIIPGAAAPRRQDISDVDHTVPHVVFSLVICVTQLLALLVLICVYQPWFLLGAVRGPPARARARGARGHAPAGARLRSAFTASWPAWPERGAQCRMSAAGTWQVLRRVAALQQHCRRVIAIARAPAPPPLHGRSPVTFPCV